MSESSQITHRGPVFSVEVLRTVDACGNVVRKDIVRHPGAVTIIPRPDDTTLIMIRNRRVSVNESLLEFPAGKIEPGESPIEAAHRELREEIGFAARILAPLGAFFTSPGLTDERMHVFVASELDEVGQSLVPGEDIQVVRIQECEFRGMIRRGEIVDGKTLAAFIVWDTKRQTSAAEVEIEATML